VTILSEDRIKLQASVESKEDAIKKCGKLLVDTGCVEPGYVDGMLAREETMSTYLGNGVSIPHGQFDNRSQILSTGISVLQIPDGVEWEPGEDVFLVIGIAAREDEHVAVLSNLAEAVEDEDIIQQMISTTDKQVILDYLNKENED
jgi:mannitol PTS system EIIA component